MKPVAFVVVGMAALSLSAAEKRLTAVKDGAFFSLETVPEEIVVERREDAPLCFVLAENGTTGYRWEVEWNTNECSVALDRRAPDVHDGRCGTPGRMVVSIVSKIHTSARIEFRYVRPWEKDVRPFKSLKVIVHAVGRRSSGG